MKVLLTGGTGFLGSALALHLREAGHDVALLLRPGSSLARLHGQPFELARCENDSDVIDFVQRVRPQAVIHTACAYGRQGESLLQLTDANLRVGLLLLQALQPVADDCVFINTGTSLPPEVSPYALSKHQFAQWGRLRSKRFVNVQLEHMFGPGDDASKFTTHVLHACHRNDPVLKLTAGEQRRDFIHIDDVVSGYATLLQHAPSLGSADVPLGSGQAPTVRELVQTVHRLCQSRTELQFGALPYRPGEAMHCQADLAVMHRLGWRPHLSLEEGLRRTIEREFV